MSLDSYHLDGTMTEEQRQERIEQDRTCLACGDRSGFPHNCNKGEQHG